ncbi:MULTISPECIES: DUF6596 domain-containing protein [Sphingobacterium]|uniref:DUF6596 domain-containing protein n=1 Tax=Sphingobacterium TaxID=28453 RepID=UPI001048C314|nr:MULTISPECIES: DUF6596 domain-containing protein [Sphingobacterium]MCW2260739.1 RNA polymerase sigma-70 factor (ECF subfamily) [Sphingobacterium kitahiroshimense]TCR09037.1 RNA polymerase sigma-70 factor (ECF subfamily) [Sphingobacterium sp. JUb78]
MSNKDIDKLTDHLFREYHGKMISFLSAKFGYQQIDNIVDAVQEAFEIALSEWRYKGTPKNCFGWLIYVSQNKLINKINRDSVGSKILNRISYEEEESIASHEAEDSLLQLLIFFSKINVSDRNKLIISLFYLCGFGYSEISRAMMLPVETIKKIILRSQVLIKKIAIQYEKCEFESLHNEMPHLLHVLYLMFNEGFKSAQKRESIKKDLCFEAIRLSVLVKKYQEDHCELNALLALFFFHVSRFPARIQENGWISIQFQNRTLWDKNLISEGYAYLNKIDLSKNRLNKYHLEALIASVHCSSPNYEKTDWRLISTLYSQLEFLEPNAIAVKINRVIAESNYLPITPLIKKMFDLEPMLNDFLKFPFYSSLAFLYEKGEKKEMACHYYWCSLSYTNNQFDNEYINLKLSLLHS